MTDLKSRLTDPTLLKSASFIDGGWVDSSDTFEVRNPADRSLVAKVADIGAGGAHRAIDAAARAFQLA